MWCVLQIALLSVEMCSVQKESEKMRAIFEVQEPSEQLQSAIRDRDDAITKYEHADMPCQDTTDFTFISSYRLENHMIYVHMIYLYH